MENEEEDVSNYWIVLIKTEVSRMLKGSIRSHCVANWLWQNAWVCLKAGRGITFCVEKFIKYLWTR